MDNDFEDIPYGYNDLKDDYVAATCDICKKPMNKGGCIGHFVIKGKKYNRIPYGGYGEYADRPCGDCAVKEGQIHHWNCDQERCPRCGGQALGCECEDFEIVYYTKKKA